MPEDKSKADDQGTEAGKAAPSDIDKLRSTYDQKLAVAGKETQSLRQEIATLELALASAESKAKSAEFTASADEEPEKLVARLKELNEAKTKAESDLEAYKRQAWPLVRRGYAAGKLLSDEQKEIIEKADERLKAATDSSQFDSILASFEAEMEVARLKEELEKAKAGEGGGAKAEVDGGRTASRRGVISDLTKLDPYNPDDRKKFEAEKRELAERAGIRR